MTAMIVSAPTTGNSAPGAILICQALFLDVWDVKPATLDRLQSMPVGTLAPLIGRLVAAGRLKIRVDPEALANVLRQLDQHRATRHQLRAIVCAGASCELVCRLFPVSQKDYRRLRYGLALAGETVKQQRTKALRFEEQLAIWRKWDALTDQGQPPGIVAERQRYLDLAAAFSGQSLATLERALAAEREYAATGHTAPDDAPVVIRHQEQDLTALFGEMSLLDGLLCGPRLAKIAQTNVPSAAPRKAVRRPPPPPSQNHPWRKMDKSPVPT
jgi:hypothetical protein